MAEIKVELSGMPIEQAIEILNKKYGANTIVIASEAKGAEISFVATGSYALDFGLGGGFPENRIIELRGPFSSFKSTIALMSAANFQKKYPEGYVVYIDLEKTFDRLYAAKLGADLTRLLIVNPDSGEQAANVMRDIMNLDVPEWIILDSVAAMVPLAEVESEMEQQFMGLQARLVGRAMRVATARLKRNLYDNSAPSTTVLALNQLRMKIGVMFGNPETSPGGMGREFFYSTIIRLSASVAKENIIAREEEVNKVKHKVRYGQRLDFKVVKNKCGGPQHEEGEFIYYEKAFEGHRPNTFNNEEALFHYGVFNGVIQWDEDDGYIFGPVVAKRESKFIEKLQVMPKLCRTLYREILAAVSPRSQEVKKVRIIG